MNNEISACAMAHLLALMRRSASRPACSTRAHCACTYMCMYVAVPARLRCACASAGADWAAARAAARAQLREVRCSHYTVDLPHMTPSLPERRIETEF